MIFFHIVLSSCDYYNKRIGFERGKDDDKRMCYWTRTARILSASWCVIKKHGY
jgi:hypothetical protein